MSKQSDKVKKWRRQTKERIVKSFGGECCICGYNKSNTALALHHLDPVEKEFNFGKVMANPKSWIKIVSELQKCVLVCHNCHSEVHCDMVEIPTNAKRFDESFIVYKDETPKTPCPVCSKLKPERQITCSMLCARRRNSKLNWDSIDLREELKTKDYVRIAEEMGCSDTAVHKRAKKLGIKK